MSSSPHFVINFFILLLATIFSGCADHENSTQPESIQATEKVLIFSKTKGWRHKSIELGTEKITQALSNKGMQVIATEDASIFNDAELSAFSALIFLNTTGDILNKQQQVAMERYIQAGGGFVGIHSATDTESGGDWFWYRRLVGAVFKGHPGVPSNVQTAKLKVLRKDHPSTAKLPDFFSVADEWYDFKSLSDRRIDLISVDEGTYNGGGHGVYHPIAWYHEFDGGRSFYTGVGHNASNFSDPIYMEHLLGGVEYAIGNNERNYAKSRPEPNRFAKDVLFEGLDEPVSLDITQDGNTLFYVERKGQVKRVVLSTNTMTEVGKIDVYSPDGFGEFGLLALALDPNFDINQHIYFMYNSSLTGSDKDLTQRVSRFTLKEGQIDQASRIDMFDAPSEGNCCHTGGNMEFDAKGNLFIALGDNSNPFESHGVGPSDFREGRVAHDAYRSAGNTQDFRGKILRITPQKDGSYTIPKGNLFANSSIGKPEIYVMGTRNPYTIAFDDKEQTLYYGDVGPDAKGYNEKYGSKGFDEINKVTQAGNFGWPSFIGNNKAYRQFDYEAQQPGKWNNPLFPMNNSPRNTGAKSLPAAQPAYIWYPYSNSDVFPELGAGSRNALVAGVYRTKQGDKALPSYYDGGLFISDFMRRWIKVVFSDQNGDIYKIEEFVPDAEFIAPIDLKFSNKGELYILEYGSKWHTGNIDAKLSKVFYTGAGNRKPNAKISIENTQGVVPFAVTASAKNSTDPDNDPLTYIWKVASLNIEQSPEQADYTHVKAVTGRDVTFDLTEKGRFGMQLSVTDHKGESHHVYKLLEVGNAQPVISITVEDNHSFIWPNQASPKYRVNIDDLEDGKITQTSENFERVNITFNKVEVGKVEKAVGHLANDPFGPGRAATKKNLCTGCHQEKEASVGPSFQKVADKYASLKDPIAYLKKTIAAGSTGRWGDHQMPAHDFLSEEVRGTLAQYILLLKSKAPSLPLTGRLPKVTEEGAYILKASYTDNGNQELSAIEKQQTHTFISPVLKAETVFKAAGQVEGTELTRAKVKTILVSGNNIAIPLGEYDLNQVTGITLLQQYKPELSENAVFELRVGSVSGKVIAQDKFNYAGMKRGDDQRLTLTFDPIKQKIPLFLVVKAEGANKDKLTANLVSFTFLN
ncbi:ThuA domain-containing protein [Pseudocolwellia agarivorans]|uniref:ThuA domain-containing protein n=1 Tax=Pseudocolwellia agarivorans TaxID=1911682 RepID=UPI000986340F|nr:ThuA domain-containing protein [Pseudocolwellia agarivorans]